MTFALLTILVFFIAFFLRIYPRMVLPHVYFSDTMFHLFYAREIRSNGHFVPRYLDRYLRTNENVYPFIYHWLVSFLPEKAMLLFERINGAVLDVINAAIVFTFLFYIDSSRLFIITAEQKFHITTLFLLCPLFLRLGSGPRAYNGSPRIFGQTLYLVHALSFILFIQTHNYFALGLSAFSIGLVSISSIFAMQVSLFFGIAFSVFFPLYFILLIVSVGLFLLLTGGRSWIVMKGAFAHSYNYVKKQRAYLYPGYRTIKKIINQYYNDLYDFLKGRKSFGDIFRTVTSDNHYVFILLLAVPFLPLSLPGLIKSYDSSPMHIFLFLWSCIAVFLFFLTKHKPFLFLGEGERYLEYSVFPFLFFLVLNSEMPVWLLRGLDVWFLCLAIYFSRQYIVQYRAMNLTDSKNIGVMKIIDRMENGLVMPIPNYHGKAILFHTAKTKVMVPYLMFDNKYFTPQMFEFIFGKNFEYPHGNLSALVKHFDVRYILSTPNELAHYRFRLLDKEIDFEALFEHVESDSKYCLYKIKN